MTKAIATNLTLPPDDGTLLPANSNNPPPDEPPHVAAFQLIDDLFDEAKNFADGQAIDSDELHDAMTDLRDKLHEAGKVAEALRVAEKKPLDDKIAEIQSRFNPYVQAKRGKVDMGKAAIDALTVAWRTKKAALAAAEAARVAKLAAEAEAAARAAMQASAGNLEARIIAEEQVDNAKAWGKAAARADKAATTGLGLRTVWVPVPVDGEADKRLDWAYGRDPGRFEELVQQMAAEAVRANVRAIPGFVVEERKVAL